MQSPIQITFRHMEPSAAVEANIRERAERLGRFADQIMKCLVVVEAPHQHQQQGRQFHVRIQLTLPGGDIVVSRDPGNDSAHEDVYVTIRDAFDAARRQLENHLQVRRGQVKRRPEPPPAG